MNSSIHNIWVYLRIGFALIGNCLLWLLPLSVLLVALILPTWLFKLDFLRFVEIVIWPFAVLTLLFFFKKIFTYLFFSMESFNFFGAKGSLENVNDIIDREVKNRLEFEKAEQKREKKSKEMRLKLQDMERSLQITEKSKSELLEIAKNAVGEWKALSQSSDKTIEAMEHENQKLKEIISRQSRTAEPVEVESSSDQSEGESQTSDPPAIENSVDDSHSQ